MSGALLGASYTLTSFNPKKPVRLDPHFIAEKTYPGQLKRQDSFTPHLYLHSTLFQNENFQEHNTNLFFNRIQSKGAVRI